MHAITLSPPQAKIFQMRRGKCKICHFKATQAKIVTLQGINQGALINQGKWYMRRAKSRRPDLSGQFRSYERGPGAEHLVGGQGAKPPGFFFKMSIFWTPKTQPEGKNPVKLMNLEIDKILYFGNNFWISKLLLHEVRQKIVMFLWGSRNHSDTINFQTVT